MVNGVITEGNNCIYSMGKTEGQYKGQRRLLSSEAIELKGVNEFTSQRGSKNLEGQKVVFVPVDGSEIRKQYSKKLENLMRVRDLDGQLINGYRTINSIAVTEDGKRVLLLETIPFSSNEQGFRSENVYKEEIIRESSEAIKSNAGGEIKILYLLDSEFDDRKIVEEIEGQGDSFIIRVKHLERTVESVEGEQNKLGSIELKNRYAKRHEKLRIKDRVYQNAKTEVEVGEFRYIGEKKYFLVKVEVTDRDGKLVYKEPMYLMTDVEVDGGQQGYGIFKNYLIRSKIEGVFKFLKDVLGWQEFRIRDIEGIKKLLAITYLVGAYFYEIGEGIISEEFVEIVSRLGSVGGKITRNALVKGLKELITTIETIKLLKDNLSDEEIIKLYASIGYGEEAQNSSLSSVQFSGKTIPLLRIKSHIGLCSEELLLLTAF